MDIEKIANRILARDEAYLDYYGLDGLVEGKATKLYHGTTRMFKKFDMSKSRDDLVNRYYGRGIFLVPKKNVAGKYAEANRNIGFDKDIIKELIGVNRTAGLFLLDMYKNGDKAWDNPKYNWRDYSIFGGLDPNDISDLSGWIIGTKAQNDAGGDSINIFSQSTGMPGYIYNLVDELGMDSEKYRPKVYTVMVKVKNTLVTKSKSEAKKARTSGYDSVVFYGSDLVDGVPEVAVFDTSKIRVSGYEVW